jgi:hypothetical protein
MQRGLSDWGGNLAAFLFAVAVNIWSNAGPINDQSMAEISARYQSLFTPAGFTFAIWGAIYLALLVFVVYQALPSQRYDDTIARISRLFQINCVANASWLIAWHYDFLNFSLVIMLVLLLTLVLIYTRLIGKIEHASVAQHLAVFLPFSLYTGWVTLATIANLSAVQTGNGWDDLGITAVNWTLLKLALVATIGATVVIRLGDVVFVLVVAWAAYGIAVMQVSTPAVSGAAATVSLVALMLAAYQGIVRLRRIIDGLA